MTEPLILGPTVVSPGARHLSVGGGALPLPTFFPSVSSVKTNFRPVEVVEFLMDAGASQFLVSAFDIARAPLEERDRMFVALGKARRSGRAVLLDSGNYEAYWHRRREWSPAELATVLALDPAPLAFSFDDQDPPEDLEAAVGGVIESVKREQAVSEKLSVVPIVHGSAVTLPDRVQSVARRLQPLLLGVPERELGDGLITRASTVRRLCAALRAVAPGCELHLLGTGNPLSILLFSICGAGSFDGLEWCQTCADPESGRLLHFQQREFVPPITGAVSGALPYAQATLLHNLTFFSSWMRRVREALSNGTATKMLVEHLPSSQRGALTEFLNAA